MFCTQCGLKLPDGALTCPRCGAVTDLGVRMRNEYNELAAQGRYTPKHAAPNTSDLSASQSAGRPVGQAAVAGQAGAAGQAGWGGQANPYGTAGQGNQGGWDSQSAPVGYPAPYTVAAQPATAPPPAAANEQPASQALRSSGSDGKTRCRAPWAVFFILLGVALIVAAVITVLVFKPFSAPPTTMSGNIVNGMSVAASPSRVYYADVDGTTPVLMSRAVDGTDAKVLEQLDEGVSIDRFVVMGEQVAFCRHQGSSAGWSVCVWSPERQGHLDLIDNSYPMGSNGDTLYVMRLDSSLNSCVLCSVDIHSGTVNDMFSLNEDRPTFAFVDGSRLYYAIQQHETADIVSTDLSGGDRRVETTFDGDIRGMCLLDKKLYWISLADGAYAVGCRDLASSTDSVPYSALEGDEVLALNAADGRIVFSVLAADGTCRILAADPDGGNMTTVRETHSPVKQIATYGGRIYYYEDSDLRTMTLSGKDSLLLTD